MGLRLPPFLCSGHADPLASFRKHQAHSTSGPLFLLPFYPEFFFLQNSHSFLHHFTEVSVQRPYCQKDPPLGPTPMPHPQPGSLLGLYHLKTCGCKSMAAGAIQREIPDASCFGFPSWKHSTEDSVPSTRCCVLSGVTVIERS